MRSTRKVRSSARRVNRSKPSAPFSLSPSSGSIRLSRPLCKRKKITRAAIFDSANASSKFTPSTAAANSPSITAASTTPNQLESKYCSQMLPADQNENSSGERQNAHDDRWNRDTGHQRHDPDQNEIDCQQEQTEIFLEVHDVSL